MCVWKRSELHCSSFHMHLQTDRFDLICFISLDEGLFNELILINLMIDKHEKII